MSRSLRGRQIRWDRLLPILACAGVWAILIRSAGRVIRSGR